jgi:predicted HTH transcriptional regulator
MDLDEELAERTFSQRDVEFSEAQLRTCRLLVDHGGELVPSNAGIVLFGRDRSKHYLDDARWRCIRYPGTTKSSEALDPKDFEDKTVLEGLPVVEAYIEEHGGTVRDIERLDRTELPALSERVVREVLVNAIAHANYEVTGSRLDVSLYADRMEVQSPGTWPPGYRLEDLQDGVSQVRNRAIARTLRTLRYMEEQGTAWARVQEAVEEGYPEPRWEPRGPVLRVVVPKHSLFSFSQDASVRSEKREKREDPRRTAARERRDRILAVLRDALPGDVPVADLPKRTDAALATIYRDLERLRDEGVVRDTKRGRIAAVPADDPADAKSASGA